MCIWIDVDVCFKVVKELVCKFVFKCKLEVWMVVGQLQVKLLFVCVCLVVVESGMDVVDDYLVEQVELGDLVICSDVLLVDWLIKKQVVVFDFCGCEFDVWNMGDKLVMCNLMVDLCDQGQMGGGQVFYVECDCQVFVNVLDCLFICLQWEVDLCVSQLYRQVLVLMVISVLLLLCSFECIIVILLFE